MKIEYRNKMLIDGEPYAVVLCDKKRICMVSPSATNSALIIETVSSFLDDDNNISIDDEDKVLINGEEYTAYNHFGYVLMLVSSGYCIDIIKNDTAETEWKKAVQKVLDESF